MIIDVLDASNVFKGLLLLIRKDRTITETEIALMRRIGKTLGFEQTFYETAIRDVLENIYIVDAPMTFSSTELAMKFIRDGFSLACSDKEFHPLEEEWLRSVAEKNGLGMKWFEEERERALARKEPLGRLEIDDLTVTFR
jgi:uncharacterized tellurite resistance protein B-like protein